MSPFNQPSPFWNPPSPFGSGGFGVPNGMPWAKQEEEKSAFQKWTAWLMSEWGNAFSWDISWLSGEAQKIGMPGVGGMGGMPALQAPRMNSPMSKGGMKWGGGKWGNPADKAQAVALVVGAFLALIWGIPAITAFYPELYKQYAFLVQFKTNSDALYTSIGMHFGLLSPVAILLVWYALVRKWHPFISMPVFAFCSFLAYYFVNEGTYFIQHYGQHNTSLISTTAFFFTGFFIAAFIGAIAFFRKEKVEITQKPQATPLTLGMGQPQQGKEKKESIMSKAIEIIFFFTGKEEAKQTSPASPFGGLPGMGMGGMGMGLPGLPIPSQANAVEEKLPVTEWKFLKLPFYIAITIIAPIFLFKTVPSTMLILGKIDAVFATLIASLVFLVYAGVKTMMLTPEFFTTPSVWFKEQVPEPVAPPPPKVETKTYDLTWQEELRDKIQEVITEQKFDGVYLGDYTEAATTIAYDIEFPKSINVSTFKLKLTMMGELLKDEEGNPRALMYRNGKIECTKDKKYCKRLFLQTTEVKWVEFKGIMERWQDEDPEGYADDDSVLVGEDTKGELVVAKLQKLPHVTVLGGSSSGKSKSFHALLYPILARNTPETFRLALADPKSELARYKSLGFLWKPLCSTGEEVEKMLQDAYEEGDNRIETFKNSVDGRTFDNIVNYNRYCREKGLPILPKILVVIDELADFTANLCQSNNKEEQERGRNIMNLITKISKKHRAQGLHMFIATQRWDASVIPMGARGQMSFLSVWMAENDAHLVLEENSGTDRLVKQTGDALFKYADKALTRVQTAFIDEEEHFAKIKEWQENPMIGTFQEEIINLSWQEELRNQVIEGLKQQRTSGIELGDYSESKMTITYEATISSGAKIENIRKALDNLTVSFGGKTFNLVTMDGKNYLEVSKPKEYQAKLFMHDRISQWVRLEGYMERAKRMFPEEYNSRYSLLLGEDQQGKPVIRTFMSLPHLGLFGASNSGKSKSYHGLAYGIMARNTPKEVQFILADPKTELHRYANLGFMWHPMISTPQELVTGLERLNSEGEARAVRFREVWVADYEIYNAKMVSKGKPDEQIPALLLFVEELASYTEALKSDKANPESKKMAAVIEGHLTNIAKKHRSQGIHMFLATQRPDAGVIAPGIRSQLGTKCAVWLDSEQNAKLALQLENSGATKLVPKTGDALIRFGENAPLRVQFPYIDENELDEKIDEWRDDENIGPAPDFDFFVEKEWSLYAKGALDLEPKPLDYNRVIHLLPEKLRQKDNIFLNRDFKKLSSQLAREPFRWDSKLLRKIFKSVQTFDTVEMAFFRYGILKNVSDKSTPRYELSCDMKGIGYAFERFGLPNFEKMNNEDMADEFADSILGWPPDWEVTDEDRQFIFREVVSRKILGNRNVPEEKKETFIYDLLKLILINLQNNGSADGVELSYNLNKYPDPIIEPIEKKEEDGWPDDENMSGGTPNSLTPDTRTPEGNSEYATQEKEEDIEVVIPTVNSILDMAKKNAANSRNIVAIAQLALIDIESIGAVDPDSILEITNGDEELRDLVLEYLVDNGEIVEDDINGGYRYIAGDDSFWFEEDGMNEWESLELPEEYRPVEPTEELGEDTIEEKKVEETIEKQEVTATIIPEPIREPIKEVELPPVEIKQPEPVAVKPVVPQPPTPSASKEALDYFDSVLE